MHCARAAVRSELGAGRGRRDARRLRTRLTQLVLLDSEVRTAAPVSEDYY